MSTLLFILDVITSLFIGFIAPLGFLVVPTALIYAGVMYFLKKPSWHWGLKVAKNMSIVVVVLFLLEWALRSIINIFG